MRVSYVIGFASVLTATFSLLLWVNLVSATEWPASSIHECGSGTDFVRLDLDGDGIADACEEKLAQMYAPIVYHHQNEVNYPTNVDWFLKRTSLWFFDDKCDPDRKWHIKDSPTQFDLLMARNNSSECGRDPRITIASNGSVDRGKHYTFFLKDLADEFHIGSVDTTEWITYFHAYPVYLGDGGTGIEIQYWRCYAFNQGPMGFSHGGDWEGIHVVLDQALKPFAVRFSQHEHIKSLPSSSVQWEESHPRVFSEIGGHASHENGNINDTPHPVCSNCTIDLNKPYSFTRQETWNNGQVRWYHGGITRSGGLINLGAKTRPMNRQYFVQYSGIWGSPGFNFNIIKQGDFTSGYWGPAYNETDLGGDGLITGWCQGMKSPPPREECYPSVLGPIQEDWMTPVVNVVQETTEVCREQTVHVERVEQGAGPLTQGTVSLNGQLFGQLNEAKRTTFHAGLAANLAVPFFQVHAPPYADAGAPARVSPKPFVVGYTAAAQLGPLTDSQVWPGRTNAGKTIVTVWAASDPNFANLVDGIVVLERRSDKEAIGVGWPRNAGANRKIVGPLNRPFEVAYEDLYGKQDGQEYVMQLKQAHPPSPTQPKLPSALDALENAAANSPMLPFYDLIAIPVDCYASVNLAYVKPLTPQQATVAKPVAMPTGQPKVPDGTVIRAAATQSLYYIQGGQRHWIGKETVFHQYGLSLDRAQTMPDASVLLIPLGPDLAPPAAPAPPPITMTMDMNLDRPGMDYKDLDMQDATFCRNYCQSDGNCRAYSFGTAQALGRGTGHCWLKNNIPATASRGGFVSGIKSGTMAPTSGPIAPLPVPPRVLSPVDQNAR